MGGESGVAAVATVCVGVCRACRYLVFVAVLLNVDWLEMVVVDNQGGDKTCLRTAVGIQHRNRQGNRRPNVVVGIIPV